MKELERGKLYQVRNYKEGWIIAEYVSKWEAHTARGVAWRGGKEVHEWKEPASHAFKYVVGGGSIRIYDKDLQVRPVTPETLAEIARLQAEIERLRQEQMKVVKELRSLCQ